MLICRPTVNIRAIQLAAWGLHIICKWLICNPWVIAAASPTAEQLGRPQGSIQCLWSLHGSGGHVLPVQHSQQEVLHAAGENCVVGGSHM